MTGEAETPLPEAALHHAPARPLVLLGMMGAGKSSLGGRLAKVLKLAFYDADAEVEKARRHANCRYFRQSWRSRFPRWRTPGD